MANFLTIFSNQRVVLILLLCLTLFPICIPFVVFFFRKTSSVDRFPSTLPEAIFKCRSFCHCIFIFDSKFFHAESGAFWFPFHLSFLLLHVCYCAARLRCYVVLLLVGSSLVSVRVLPTFTWSEERVAYFIQDRSLLFRNKSLFSELAAGSRADLLHTLRSLFTFYRYFLLSFSFVRCKSWWWWTHIYNTLVSQNNFNML